MYKENLCLDQFCMLGSLGYGNYSKVLLVRRKTNGKLYAMKIIKKNKQLRGIHKDHAFVQKQILMACQHPFVVQIHGTFQTKNKLYYILEYCPGGELFGVIKRKHRMCESQCKFYAGQIYLALEHLHSQKVIYRDLKPENVVIDRIGYVRLIDFGVSQFQTGVQSKQMLAGTPEYLPPEVFNPENKIGYEVDWWCFGCLIFQMSVGFPPFYKPKQKIPDLVNRIKTHDPPLHYINDPVLKDFLKKVLQKQPTERLGFKDAKQIKKHPWMSDIPWEKLMKKQIKAPFKPELHEETDTRWFQLEADTHGTITPPESMSAKSAQSYQQFNLSWRSTPEVKNPPSNASPTEIIFNIEENKSLQSMCSS